MTSLFTERLELLPLNSKQLRLCLERPDQLEIELGLPLSRAMITDRVRRAIQMKLIKMENVEEPKLPWLTYWLIIIREIPLGAGLVGFKGFPDPHGEVEIGYGIDPAQQRQGYTTEAVKRMIQWAFEEQACFSIVAIGVNRLNVASQHVLTKAGMIVVEESEESLSYRIKREEISRSWSSDKPAQPALAAGPR